MRLVMLYTFGDGCTYSCDRVFPLVSESPEAALCAFEELYNKHKGNWDKGFSTFTFADEEFYSCDFECNGKYYAPDFLTIDEWFKGIDN